MGALKLPQATHMPDMESRNLGKKADPKALKEKASHLQLITHDNQVEDLRENPPAGFWIRFLAAVVDGITVGLLNQGAVLIIAIILGAAAKANPIMMGAISLLGGVVFTVLYYVYPTSKWGCTLGKKVFKLRVINTHNGDKVSTSKAFKREIFGKFVSNILLMIGYIMAAFTQDKKALHDMIAGTRVVKVPKF